LRRTRPAQLSSADAVTALKAAAEPTRLRILALLAAGELNVTDLTRILGQSQPRISRHVKLLSEAGLIERFKEGSWVYFHLTQAGQNSSHDSDERSNASLARALLDFVDPSDPVLMRDRDRADALKQERQTAAQAFFAEHAAKWDEIRSLHVAETEVEAAIVAAIDASLNSSSGPIDLLVDLGTGTGRILELLAGHYNRGLGIDVNQSMLAFARANLVAAGLSGSAGHSTAQVRHGDLYHLGLADGVAGAVIMHQVLHFLSDPQAAVREAARILAPGGRLLIVDFAPHNLDFLRETYAHERLGFPAATVDLWLREAGLNTTRVQNLITPRTAAATENQLTVSLWLATRPALKTKSGPDATPQSMETTQ
jgi:DNA-binding transcriptional ArsR family regulator/ubiquinone/menaquinone biosynthesis C-methylase UbiE